MIRILFSRIFATLRRGSLDEDFDAEVHTHLQMLIEENITRGMSPSDARDAAQRSLGSITSLKEIQRERRGLPQIDTLIADLRYGVRMLRANPGFTLIAALTLTLGIGVTTTVFTAYNAVALKALPVSGPDTVVRLERWFQRSRGSVQYEFSYPEYVYCRDRNDVFASMVAASGSLPVVADGLERLQGTLVSANYFAGLGVTASIGRTFLPVEDRAPGENPVIVISHLFGNAGSRGIPR